MNRQQVIKTTVFIIIGALLITAVGCFLRPVWMSWNNYDTVHGFYEEPENTIETVFLGASIVVNGITPTELYENYGICAYNLATEQQPMLASYYWLEEAERLHGETLKTVVLDTSMLRRTPEREFYQKALDAMQFSSIKLRAAADYTEDFNEMLSYLCPLFAYHGRWASLEQTDFEKRGYEACRCVRGYNFTTGRILETTDDEDLAVPRYCTDSDTADTDFSRESLYYLKKMIDYCSEHDIKLILMKTPAVNAWSDADHNAVEHIADACGLPFFDFNYEPYLDEMGYEEPLDNADGTHMNYHGAHKLTEWFGEYLTDECDATDVRGNEAYSFMEEESEEYQAYVTAAVNLKNCKTVAEYLTLASQNPDYLTLITVKDEAASSITDAQREAFSSLGLSVLASLEYRDSYIGILDGTWVGDERTERASMHPELNRTAAGNDLTDLTLEKEEEPEVSAIRYICELEDGTDIVLKSGSYAMGNISSCTIDHTEYSPNGRGINVVVYNRKNRRVVDTAVFDTHAYAEREMWDLEAELEEAEEFGTPYEELSENLQKLISYNERCEAQRHSAISALYEQEVR